MKIWKERDSDACPRCGAFEDAPHVWTCSGEGADEVWAKSIHDLEEWMTSVGTDLDILNAIVMHLTRWKTQQEVNTRSSWDLSDLVEQQEVIGWRNFFEGWMSSAWEEAQHQHYVFIKSRHTGKRWAISLIKKLWQVAWDLWEHRNGILHKKECNLVQEESRRLDQRIRGAYFDYKHSLPRHGRYLTSLPLRIILSKDTIYKTTWLTQIQLATATFKHQQWMERHREVQSMNETRRRMRDWLRQTR